MMKIPLSPSLQLLVLNSLGLFVSFFLVLQHFGLAGATSLCEMGSSFSCSRVLSSSYAVLFGAPVAVHGLSYFVLASVSSLLCVLYGGASQAEFRVRRDVLLASFLVSAVGLASVFYFVAAEYMIGSICPLCTMIHLFVVLTFVISLRQLREGAFAVWSLGSLFDIASNRIVFLMVAGVIVMLPIVIFNLPPRHPVYHEKDLEGLASCLAARKVKMFGSMSCGHCIQQKGMFGTAFEKIPFINCEKVKKIKMRQKKKFVFI